MSLCLSLITADGLVIAGDSRISYTNLDKIQKVRSDYGSKVFRINDHCGLTFVGIASFYHEGRMRNIKWLINSFLKKEGERRVSKMSVKEVADKISKFFAPIVDDYIPQRKEGAKSTYSNEGYKDITFEDLKGFKAFNIYGIKDGKTESLGFIYCDLEITISGYDKKSSHSMYKLDFIFDPCKLSQILGPVSWSGQKGYVDRIIRGYNAGQFNNLPFFKSLNNLQPPQTLNQIFSLPSFQNLNKVQKTELQTQILKDLQPSQIINQFLNFPCFQNLNEVQKTELKNCFSKPSFIENLNNLKLNAINQQLEGMFSNISFDLMTLQDGIELAELLIKTTSAMQRFSDGTIEKRSEMHGVGGAIDVAVITPFEGFHWISKKKPKLYGKEVDIEQNSKPKKKC